MKDLLHLYLAFCKLGCITFGGGMGMIPVLQRELVEKKQWITEEEMMDYFAIARCTPGVVFVNTATFIGYKQKGYIGGTVATLGIVTPAIIIIAIIAAFLQNFSELAIIQHAFAGIRVCVSILILDAVRRLLTSSVIDKPTGVIFVACLLLTLFTNISPVWFIIAAALAGLFIKYKGGEMK